MSDFRYTADNPRYRFLLLEDVTVDTGLELGVHTFHDAAGVRRVSLCGSLWTVHAGYAWDGCSPKCRIAGRWVGTPDFEASRLASLIHDTGYQFLGTACFPLRRHDVDCLFGHIIARDGRHVAAAMVYAGAVWLFGGIHRGLGSVLTRRKKTTCFYHGTK
ncbi:MAG: hypothetical protein FGM22_08340 [Burkholderiaceae bacterium]|nr:hypothetical protein [Burkholderiaceae bacterium]